MKYLIVLGDGMADWAHEDLQGKTLLQYASTPHMDWLAHNGRMGLLETVPEGFHPGSEVANSSILGYDQRIVYQGRGPLEAASIGVELADDDLALRCNLVSLSGDLIKNHSCGRLETAEGDELIRFLDEKLGSDRVRFYTGVQYRHLLVVKGGKKNLRCTPPHDIPMQPWEPALPQATAPEAEETAELLRKLMLESQKLLATHPLNLKRQKRGMDPANSIWPWGGGMRPQMEPLTETFDEICCGAVITAVDLIKGIGRYAGLRVVNVEGATGLWDTNYEGKAKAAIRALRSADFVYVHVEAADEAGHEGDRDLKLRTIEDLDQRLIRPILEGLGAAEPFAGHNMLNIDGEPVAIALLPDHPTPVALRTHTSDPIPFCICKPGLSPDATTAYSEVDAREGAYGLLRGREFIDHFIKD